MIKYGDKMQLSEFDKKYFDVIKNGEFETLGNVTSSPQKPSLSFITSEKYISKICKNNDISCVICTAELAVNEILRNSGKGIAISENPKYAFQHFHNDLIIQNDRRYTYENLQTVIGKNCVISEKAIIAPYGVCIGDNVRIEAYAVIKEGVTIGDNCVIMVGAIIGYSACLAGRDLNNNLYPLLSGGTVKLENNVQIGSYSCVSRGLFPYEEARVGAYSLIGFSVDLSHNDVIGKNVIVLDQSQICGNVVAGDDVHISPQAIISNRLYLEEKADVAIGAVVVSNIKKGVKVAGNYAIEHSKFLMWHRKKLKNK